jgi:choline kinase
LLIFIEIFLATCENIGCDRRSKEGQEQPKAVSLVLDTNGRIADVIKRLKDGMYQIGVSRGEDGTNVTVRYFKRAYKQRDALGARRKGEEGESIKT